MHRRWLAGLKFEQPLHHIVMEDCIAAVEAATARRDRLEAQIAAALPDWSLAPVVSAIHMPRDVRQLTQQVTGVGSRCWLVSVRFVDERGPPPAHGAERAQDVALLRWRHAEPQLAGEGVVVTAPKSRVRQISPWHGISRTAAAQLAHLET